MREQSTKNNFDPSHDLEEILIDENPLKAKPRKKKPENEDEGKNGKAVLHFHTFTKKKRYSHTNQLTLLNTLKP